MKSPFVIALLVLLCGFAVGLVREYIFIETLMKWKNAQSYCRQYYRDLSSITSQEENELVVQAAGSNLSDSWIGLYRSSLDENVWLWSDGELVSFYNWKSEEPSSTEQKCVQLRAEGWFDDNCSRTRAFFCERILVLVMENKTWEEAYEYCRAHYTGLAFLSSQTQLDLAKNETSGTQTMSVWTGLRFLAGEWLWVNGEPLGSLVSLPSCPAQPYRCGARNVQMDVWENRDCEEKLSFLCY